MIAKYIKKLYLLRKLDEANKAEIQFLEAKLQEAARVSGILIHKKYPKAKLAEVRMYNDLYGEGPHCEISSKDQLKIRIPRFHVANLGVVDLVRLITHEQGHYLFTTLRLYKKVNPVLGINKTYDKNSWDKTYPQHGWRIWWWLIRRYFVRRTTYVDYLHLHGLAIKYYATRHLEEELVELFAASCDPSFKKGKLSKVVKLKMKEMENLVSSY